MSDQRTIGRHAPTEPVPGGALRRLDWRFLLPVTGWPRGRIALVGADDDVVDAARRIRFADQVDARLDPSAFGQYDVIAVFGDGEAVDPTVVSGLLAPEGAVWWEVDRRRRGHRLRTPQRLAGDLTRAGLHVVAAYGLRPAPERCELYVPLDRSRALAWYLDAVYAPVSPVQRAGAALLRVTTGLHGPAVAPFVPFHAVIASAAPPPHLTVGELVDSSLERTAVISHGGSRAILLGFDDDHPAPRVVVKVPTQPAGDARTSHEYAAVRDVRKLPDAAVAAAVPAAIGLLADPPGMVQAAAPGRSLSRLTALRSRSLADKSHDLQMVGDWLGRLHRWHVDGDRHTWDGSRHESVVERCEAYATRFGLEPHEQRLFARTVERSEDLLGAPVPTVWEHGDLTVWNVFRDGDRVHVLDWEGARPGLPLADLLRFVTHWHELALRCRTRAQGAAALAALVTPTTTRRATTAARDVVDGYCASLGLPPELEDVLHVSGWAEIAVRRDDHRREHALAGIGSRDGINAVDYLATLARVIA